MSNEQGSNYYHLPPDQSVESAYPILPQPNRPTNRARLPRVMQILALLCVMAVILTAQLIRYQVFGRDHVQSSPEQTAGVVDPMAPRGTIADRNGNPLAMDIYRYQVIADASNIKNQAAVAQQLAPMLGVPEAEILTKLRDNPDSKSVRLDNGGIGADSGEKIIASQWVTVTAQAMPDRYYPEGKMACHLLGFVAKDRRGYYGVEAYYDDFLRAKTLSPRLNRPLQVLATDGESAKPLPDSIFLPSHVQQDLVLTLDRTIQHMIEEELRSAVDRYRAEGGTIIVLEPKTSAILGMASWPAYSPNDFTKVASNEDYVNPATSELYEPGSVFKVITLASALSEGVITPTSKMFDEERFIYGERTFQNSDRQGHGLVDLTKILTLSLNVSTAKIAVELGNERFYKAVRRFGFGQLTGAEIFGEVPGIVKLPGKEGWYPSDLATNAFGQGISVTPLQMANALAAIAADGVLHRANIVQQIIDGDHVVAVEPQPLSRAITPEAAKEITKLMVETVESTPNDRPPGYAIAAKSGTAEIPLATGYSDEYTIATYAGFFPPDAPQFVILVKLDRPKTSPWAAYTAAPTFFRVVRNLIQLFSIPPDDIRTGQKTVQVQP